MAPGSKFHREKIAHSNQPSPTSNAGAGLGSIPGGSPGSGPESWFPAGESFPTGDVENQGEGNRGEGNQGEGNQGEGYQGSARDEGGGEREGGPDSSELPAVHEEGSVSSESSCVDGSGLFIDACGVANNGIDGSNGNSIAGMGIGPGHNPGHGFYGAINDSDSYHEQPLGTAEYLPTISVTMSGSIGDSVCGICLFPISFIFFYFFLLFSIFFACQLVSFTFILVSSSPSSSAPLRPPIRLDFLFLL